MDMNQDAQIAALEKEKCLLLFATVLVQGQEEEEDDEKKGRKKKSEGETAEETNILTVRKTVG